MTAQSDHELVLVPGGYFEMGSLPREKGRRRAPLHEGPVHEVSVRPFWLGIHQVTNERYRRFLEERPESVVPAHWLNPLYNQPRQPVVGVSWTEARAYCAWAGARLPTEAEWEYACRAGTTTPFWSGDAEADLARVGWYQKNSEYRLHPVGEKPANPFGLFDMHGNAWDWCEDDGSPDYRRSQEVHPGAWRVPSDERLPPPRLDPPESPAEAFPRSLADRRVIRGGHYDSIPARARSASRSSWPPEVRLNTLGFRLAKDVGTG